MTNSWFDTDVTPIQRLKQIASVFTGRRGSLLLIAIVLSVVAIGVWLGSPFASATNEWIYGTLGKVAICLVALFFAWPSFQKIRRIPGGNTVSIIGSLLVALMVARPRFGIYLLPFAVIVALILVSLQWSSEKLKRRGKR